MATIWCTFGSINIALMHVINKTNKLLIAFVAFPNELKIVKLDVTGLVQRPSNDLRSYTMGRIFKSRSSAFFQWAPWRLGDTHTALVVTSV